jgi:glucose/arabinose dehydrogenase
LEETEPPCWNDDGMAGYLAFVCAVAMAAVVAGCGGGGSGTSVASAAAQGMGGPTDSRIHLATGFASTTVANVAGARELAALPNGDLLVGTTGSDLYIVPNAEAAGAVGTPQPFVALGDSPAAGVAYGPSGAIYAATQHAIWRIAYHSGDRSEPASSIVKIADVRQGGIPFGSDGDVHHTTSVAVNATTVFAAVGSSCNACTEIDPTRATIQQMGLDGSAVTTKATRIRNAIGLAINPATNSLWAGGAGQDALPPGHPYEFFDDVSAHAGVADYGWPACEENRNPFGSGANCATAVAPRVEFPAYSTIVGAAFYPAAQRGPYAFPQSYRGGAFVSMHGSWHACRGRPCVGPHVAFVAISGDAPATPVDWNDSTRQWTDFMYGFQDASGNRIGRTTGLAVGVDGSLFVADDQTGDIYRIRPH